MKKTLLLLPFFFLLAPFFIATAQNLVPNPSFEDTVNCPQGIGDFFVKEWYLVGQSPDYFNSCSKSRFVSVPVNCFGYQSPSSGKAYAGFLSHSISNRIPNYREIIGASLISPLVPGQKYFVGMKVNRADSFNCATNKIGILFSVSSIDFNSIPIHFPNYAHIYTTSIVTDTINWINIAGSIVADSFYKYIYIGNFSDDNNTDTLFYKGTKRNVCNIVEDSDTLVCNAYYFVDDVSVIKDTTNGIAENDLQKTITIYPNPFSISTNIIINDELEFKNWDLRIYDILGCEVKHTVIPNGIKNFMIKRDNLPNGIYLLKISTSSKIINRKLTITN